MMKHTLLLTTLIVLGVVAVLTQPLWSADRAAAGAEAPRYEYNVMSLVEMFADAPNPDQIKKKILQMTVRTSPGIHRTDLDVSDYEEAINRLAGEGWELVTVNKSNYWVFRRPAAQ